MFNLSKFGFLFNISALGLQNCDDKILRNHCTDLNALLSESSSNASATECQHGNESTQSIDSDIEELNLFTKLKAFAHVVSENATALQSLRYILKFRLDGAFPNVTTALRIFLTVPVTVASAERSFSKPVLEFTGGLNSPN